MTRSLVFSTVLLAILLQTNNVAGFQAFQKTRQSSTALHDGRDSRHDSTESSLSRKGFLVGLGLAVGTGFPVLVKQNHTARMLPTWNASTLVIFQVSPTRGSLRDNDDDRMFYVRIDLKRRTALF